MMREEAQFRQLAPQSWADPSRVVIRRPISMWWSMPSPSRCTLRISRPQSPSHAATWTCSRCWLSLNLTESTQPTNRSCSLWSAPAKSTLRILSKSSLKSSRLQRLLTLSASTASTPSSHSRSLQRSVSSNTKLCNSSSRLHRQPRIISFWWTRLRSFKRISWLRMRNKCRNSGSSTWWRCSRPSFSKSHS